MSDTKYVIDRDTLVGIADAIRGKDGSTGAIAVTSLAQKITDIPSGSDVVYKSGTAYGTGTRYVTVEHGMGITPEFIYFYIDDGATRELNRTVSQRYFNSPYGADGIVEYHSSSTTSTSKAVYSMTVTETTFVATSNSSNRPWIDGALYHWEAWGGYGIESTSTQSDE